MATIAFKTEEEEQAQLAMQSFDLKKISENACKNMSQKDMENMHYRTQEECVDGMQTIIQRFMIAMLVLGIIAGVIIPMHFACVLYNHWKNSDKEEADGGARVKTLD